MNAALIPLIRLTCCALVLALAGAPARATSIMSDVPAHPDAGSIYLIYLHGQIIEDAGPRPTHPQFGLYDFPAVLGALASRDAVVISQQRPPGTGVRKYAEHVTAQITRLIDAGVPASNIVVVGFSKGGAIAMLVAAALPQPQLRYVFLASCWNGMRGSLSVHGRVLSIFEASDALAGSCAPLFASATAPASFDEVRISTGSGHGAFYLPRSEWLHPLLDWIAAPAATTQASP